jgi:signal transduction histidine kinase/DNA-binding NarL/FixJ family response regulator
MLDGRPALLLGLAVSRDSTSENIRETVTAILGASALILLLAVGAGLFWVGQLIGPVVRLTREVKEMEDRSRIGAEHSPNSQTLLEELRPVAVSAPDEAGELATAFNAMIVELRHSLYTLEKRAQERMARDAALEEAARHAQLRTEFFAQVSHELRTPLNAILGYAQILLRERDRLTDRQASSLATILESGEHLLTLINDLLDLARMEAAKLELYPRDVELAPFLRGVAEIIRVKAEQKSLSFHYERSRELPPAVRVDDKRLRQVLLNLLGNAIKFTDRGNVALRLLPASVNGPTGSVRMRFEIEDSGIGLSEEQLGKIFRPFEQLSDEGRREGGTGLGLAISRELVSLMGGEIAVRSKPGSGSLFSFELDLPVAERPPAPALCRQSATGYAGPRRTVLIVDDIAQNRIMLSQSLSTLGFNVAEAVNGRVALEQAETLLPDLIVMDVMMPVMDGLEATRRLRDNPALTRIPVIVVSASTTDEDKERALAAGGTAFVPKPIDLAALFEVIGGCLELSWTYGESAPAACNLSETPPVKSTIPPADELEVLHALAQVGDMRDIRERAGYLRTLDPRYEEFAAHLESLAARYQSKAIAAFIEQYRGARSVTETGS